MPTISPCLGHAEALYSTPCHLGEGPSWDAARGEFRWLDILGLRLHRHHLESGEHRVIELQQLSSFAQPLADGDDLLVTEHGLAIMEHAHGQVAPWRDVEADNSVTRSNDARADQHGGLWFSTMGKHAEPGAGSLYRLYRGTIYTLRTGISIPNALCFSADGQHAWLTDTTTQVVMRWSLDADGFPQRADGSAFLQNGQAAAPDMLLPAEPWADFSNDPGNPDGAVVDSEGCMWLALWGSGRVARLSPEGKEIGHVQVNAEQPSCPAFGGRDLTTLLITTATEGQTKQTPGRQDGATFIIELRDILPGVRGQHEEPLHIR